ncbi:uncharacterized protein SPPG_00158 [Spizellomyces punctatus DAOM BR117]|uniref:SH3 domain-containing protein n=1 Tax=Spizellomyces punctatus (strain DAOM BR117) TaxID=645134 RepID=A0A0L0HU76_SPIPD|nr:uncharacterized protein SPPG_00158 [Spizellomyces punctatus DAOM BR117]KND04429.1 hypothetical protein SPPG_00158 [Spizellomyces punctatus DAOM BR117]|eukprot:XP_016612468.1 hypothetical protein SPPG_00158 [Spizellomyces punctatus DAOM BR117]
MADALGNGEKGQYRAIASYDPVYTDEIQLTVGDRVAVVQSYDDGWILAYNQTTNARGLVPFNFLSPVKDTPAPRTKPSIEIPPPVPSKDSQEVPSPATLQRISSLSRESKKETPILSVTNSASPPDIILDTEATGGKVHVPLDEPRPSQASQKTLYNGQNGALPTSEAAPMGLVASNVFPSPVSSKRSEKAVSEADSVAESVKSGVDTKEADLERSLSVNSMVNAVMAVADRSEGQATRQQIEDQATQPKQKLQHLNASKNARARNPSAVGVLKIAVVGDSGIGKTSLIQNFLSGPEVTASQRIPTTEGSHTDIILASTSTHPTRTEGNYNLTFVDTPGFGAQMDAMATIKPVVEYHLEQFKVTDQIFVRDIEELNLYRFLIAPTGAHTHVDVVLFGILHRLKPVDIEYMKRLVPYVPIVPVIFKCDTLTSTELYRLKMHILQEVKRAGIDIYGFGMSVDELINLARAGVDGAVPFAVSTPITERVDGFGGDAQPITTGERLNEFKLLKSRILSTHVDEIRTLTARKFVKWREGVNAYERQRQLEAEREAEERARARAATAQAQAQAHFNQQQYLYQQAVPVTSHHHKPSTGGKILNSLFGRKSSSASTLSVSPPGSLSRMRRSSEETATSERSGFFDRGGGGTKRMGGAFTGKRE